MDSDLTLEFASISHAQDKLLSMAKKISRGVEELLKGGSHASLAMSGATVGGDVNVDQSVSVTCVINHGHKDLDLDGDGNGDMADALHNGLHDSVAEKALRLVTSSICSR